MKYYKIYHQFIRRFIAVSILGMSGFGIGAIVYFLTDSPEAGGISVLAMVFLALVLWFKWGLALPCPCCGRHTMNLLGDQAIHPIIHGYRKYYVQCRKCGTKIYTDLAMKQTFFWNWYVKLTEEEIQDESLSGF